MILRLKLRPQNVLQAATRAFPNYAHLPFRRHYHEFPELRTYGKLFRESGVPGMLSKDGYEMSWTQYQGMLVEKLNQLTFGTVDDGISARDLVLKYAHDSSKASLFNYASMAGNNHFFFEHLHPTGTKPSPTFMEDIKLSFDSFETLRTEMLETADAMFGNGFVWLMKDDTVGMLRILCTYNAGSPWPQAHYRRQSYDMSTEYTRLGRDLAETRRLNTVQNPTGSFGASSRMASEKLRPTNGLTGGPILCVNTWQHMYLRDYGVSGKKQYLAAWWERINWPMVEQSAQNYGSDSRHGTSSSFPGNLFRVQNRIMR